MRVVRVVEGTSVDGPGLRTSIYFAGCSHRCPGCHNPSTWDFSAGSDRTVTEIMAAIREYGLNVTFSGGDPMYQADAIRPLAQQIKDAGLTLWCYTGFCFEEAIAHSDMRQLLEYIDVLVDGPFIEKLRDTSLLFRGSSNQRLIDVAASLHAGSVVLFEPDVSVV
ncbi:MAG: anaerobic ribonucleoside-triphosphate reductase activating protein [Muribaculaceae bacterium]|nr:anaerobic ribonucleoside-triphosphate reductase activating protein [Muribaculaceae bacterium]